jgi:hypothetical protein
MPTGPTFRKLDLRSASEDSEIGESIGRKLKDVQELPQGEATTALLESTIDEHDEENHDMARDGIATRLAG